MFGDNQQLQIFLNRFEGNHRIPGIHTDANYTGGRSTHRSHIRLLEADRHAVVGDKDYIAKTIGLANPCQLIARIESDGDQAVGSYGAEVLQSNPLHRALAGNEEEVLGWIEITDCKHGGNAFIRKDVDHILNRQTLGLTARIRQFMHHGLINATAISEHQE